jgi:hypothetical protein
MNARRLLRTPLAYLVAFEVCVSAALVGWTIHVFHGRQAVVPEPQANAAVDASIPAPDRSPQSRSPAPRPSWLAAPKPGRTTTRIATSTAGPSFAQLNRSQALWEAAEWRIASTAIAAARSYLERVVLPAILKAEKDPGGKSG